MNNEIDMTSPSIKQALLIVLGACLAAQTLDTLMNPIPFSLSPKGILFWLLVFLGSALLLYGSSYLVFAIPAWLVWRGIMKRPRESTGRALLFALVPTSALWAALMLL